MYGISYVAKVRQDNQIQVMEQDTYQMMGAIDAIKESVSGLVDHIKSTFDPEDAVQTDIVESLEAFKERGADLKFVIKDDKFYKAEEL